MVQPKYNPQEALDKIKLMMKYDSSKTLNENVGIVKEQVSTPIKKDENILIVTDNDLTGDTGKIRQYFQQMSDFSSVAGVPNLMDIIGVNFANLIGGRRLGVKGVVDALDGFVDSKDLTYILAVIKSLDGKCYYDDVNGKNVPAIVRFLELYKEDENEDLVAEINKVGTRTLPVGTDKIKQQIIKQIEILQTKSCTAKTENISKLKSGSAKSSYAPCQKGKYVKGCKSDVVKQVQVCLGMPPKYQTGNFGSITQGQLQTKFPDLAKGFTDADIQKICTKQPAPAVQTPGEQGVEDANNA